MKMNNQKTVTDLAGQIWAYHKDRVFPCLPSEVRDLADLYSVPAMAVVIAINELLGDEDDSVMEGEYA